MSRAPATTREARIEDLRPRCFGAVRRCANPACKAEAAPGWTCDRCDRPLCQACDRKRAGLCTRCAENDLTHATAREVR
jgi:hypothetical protein